MNSSNIGTKYTVLVPRNTIYLSSICRHTIPPVSAPYSDISHRIMGSGDGEDQAWRRASAILIQPLMFL